MELAQHVAESVRAHLDICKPCAARDARLIAAHDSVLGRIRGWDINDRRQVFSTAHEPLTPSPSGGPTRMLESPLPEGVIPGYDILSEIHRGGQGVVYRARQRSTKRDVAIKVLLEGPFASRAARRRFEREIELVAGLNHPHIVAVFDSGSTSDGRQFCVMDYVDGARLDHFVRDNKLDAGSTLKLFADICDAVNFAHQRGVMHRDLKPSNILVDLEGRPRILDFGLAKQVAADDDPLVSMTGQVLGTLPYLSPEQARGAHDQVDIRADVYALGVILYELLTGQYPYPVVGQLADVLLHIAETAPRRPGIAWRKDAGVRAAPDGGCPLNDEIETISLKALSKEPDRRYQSAGELGRDVTRYLSGELIEAKRDSTWYILRKTLRKRRGTVLAGTLFVGLLIAWGATTSYFYAAQKKQTVRIAEEADRAKRRFDQVRELANAVLFDFHDAIADLPGATPVRALLVKKALKYLDNLSQEAGDDASLIRELATAYAKVGDVQGSVRVPNIGDTAGAMVSFKKALALLESIAESHPDPFILKDSLAKMHAFIGDMHWSSGDMDQSLAEYRVSRDLAREMLAMHKDDAEATRVLVARCQDIGDVLLQTGRRDEAVQEFQAGLAMIEPLAMAPNSDAASIILCAINYDRLATIAMEGGRIDDALDLYKRSLRLREDQATANPGSVKFRVFLANSLNQMCNIILQMGRPDEAMPYAERARDLRRAISDADADDARAAFELAVSHDQVASVHLNRGELEAALDQQKLALALRESISSQDPTNAWYREAVAVSHDAAGESLYRMGRHEEAETEIRRALTIRDDLIAQIPSDHSLSLNQSNTLTSLGNVLWELNRLPEARAALDRALAIRVDTLARNPDDVSAALAVVSMRDRLGDLMLFEGKLDDAAGEFDQCHQLAARAVKIDPVHRPTRRCMAVAELKLGILAARRAEQPGAGAARRVELIRTALTHFETCDRLLQKMRDDKLINQNDKPLFSDVEHALKNARKRLTEWTGQSPYVAPVLESRSASES